MYQVIASGIAFSPCHTKELADICAKQFIGGANVVKTEHFIQPVFTLQHEWNLLKFLR